MSLVAESTLGGAQLERPQEVVGILEVSSDIVDLVDQVFNTDDIVLSKSLFNNFVGGDGDSLLVDLSVSSLVDHVGDSMSGGESESDIRLDLLDHVEGGSVNSDKGGVVDLSESQQLEDLFDLRSQIVDTSDSDDKEDLGFSRDIEGSFSSGLSLKVYEFLLFGSEFLEMSFTSLGVFSSLGLGLISSLLDESLSGISKLGVSSVLLLVGLGSVGLNLLLGLFDLH